MIHARIKHFVFTFYWLIALIAFVIVSVWFLNGSKGKDEITVFLTIVGALLSAFYFIQKQQHEELALFNELFSSFNNRYDLLNEEMNRIAFDSSDNYLTPEEKKTLNKYFNLCAEEYLFYKRGYIYPEVWKAWHNGMKFYLNKNKRIKDYWIKEMETDSYYGLTIKYDQEKSNEDKPKQLSENTFDEILAPFRRNVEKSGITDEELEALFSDMRKEVIKVRKEK